MTGYSHTIAGALAGGCFLVKAADGMKTFKFADKGDSGALIYFKNDDDQIFAAGLVMYKIPEWRDSRDVVHDAPTVAFLLKNGVTALRNTLKISVTPAVNRWHRSPLKVHKV